MKIIAINNSQEFNSETKKKLLEMLTPFEIYKTEKLYGWKNKQNFILGKVVVRMYISENFDIPIENIIFKIDSYGKPFFSDSSIHFNISHSNSWVVIALDTVPVGIDIEKISSFKTFEFTSNFFSFDEKELFYRINSLEKRNAYFTELWTVKESYTKLVGHGLNIPLNTLFAKKKGDYHIISNNSNLYHIKQYNIAVNYKLSVCSSEKNNIPENIEVLDVNDFVIKYIQTSD